ncbi:MAG TPA: dipeptide ABC transporter ATP-binding protein [Rhizomicrobium sp.]
MTLLRVDKLSVTFGKKQVLNGTAFSLSAGEILAIAGESGSGKSTAALAIAHLLPAAARVSGSVLLEGDDLNAKGERALCGIRGRDIGLVFQEPMTALNPVMQVGDQIAESLRLHRRISRSEAREAVRNLLERVGLIDIPATRYPHELSGGQRQRVAIAIAIACSPKLIIADEPTTALDVTTQAQVLALFRQLVREERIGLILITHDLAVVAETADRIAIMNKGRIVEEGTTLQVLREPRHASTRELVEALSRFPDRISKPRNGRPLLEVSNLVRHYGGRFLNRGTQTAVADVSFTVEQGESVGIVGESGSGKSTLLRAVLGLDRPNGGDVRIAGTAISSARGKKRLDVRRKVQAVFQDPLSSFDPRHHIGRVVAEPLHLLGENLGRVERRKRAEAALERVGLPARMADRYPHEFSGGQRQRIAIARALIIEPALIALDEAVSALDVSARAQIVELLNGLSRDLGVAYLFVTHDLSLVRSITDRLIVMRAGRIVETGATGDVLSAPQHPYTAALLAATPDLRRALGAGRTAAAADIAK